MFNQTFVNGTHGTKKPATVLFSVVLQVAVICILIGLPLVYTEALPNAQLKNLLVAPPPPQQPVTQTPARHVQTRTATRIFVAPRLVAPAHIPNRIIPLSDAPSAPDIASPGTGPAASNLGMDGLVAVTGVAPPPPPPAAKRRPTGPVRIGGKVAQANVIYSVQPVYPPLAKAARIQGAVEFTATISKQGTIEDLTLVRGHPLLVNAARQAVSQWKYRPTLLNGQPVEVVTDITVNFILSQ